MSAKLFCKSGALDGASFTIESEATIGRGEDNQIRLDSALVSTRHARLSRDPEEGVWLLEDLDSLNGTELDGVPVRGSSERLRHLHVISFGGSGDFIFQVVGESDEMPAAAPAETAEPAPPEIVVPAADTAPEPGGTLAEQVAPALPAALAGPSGDSRSAPPEGPERTQVEQAAAPLPSFLAGGQDPATPEASAGFFVEIVDTASGERRTVELAEGETILGRASDAGIRIVTDYLSRRHAVLTVKAGTVSVRDLGSTNGTFLGGEQIPADRETPWAPGDELLLGEYVLRLEKRGTR